jgi:hypothetical protein
MCVLTGNRRTLARIFYQVVHRAPPQIQNIKEGHPNFRCSQKPLQLPVSDSDCC